MKKTLAVYRLALMVMFGLGVSLALISSVLAQGGITPDSLHVSVLDTGLVTESAVANGSLRVLVRAANPTSTNTRAYADGVPDEAAFDYGLGEIPVTCPVEPVTGYSFGAPTAEAGAIFFDHNNREITDQTVIEQIRLGAYTGEFATYHAFTCPYAGSGAIGAIFQTTPDGSQNTGIVIGVPESALINPTRDPESAALLPEVNQSVSVPGFLQNLNSDGETISSVEVIISAQVNEVVVTARTVGEISFKITGVPEASQTACNLPTSSSTPTLIDFGSPSLNTFADVAQQLQITSSSTGGYAVSMAQSDQMGLQGVSCPGADGLLDAGAPTERINRDCIPDFNDVATTTSAAPFTDAATQKGLGYTVVLSYWANDISAAEPDFAGGAAYRQLADVSADEEPARVATSVSKTDYDVYDICYRLTTDATNHAGMYENQINYYVTATF